MNPTFAPSPLAVPFLIHEPAAAYHAQAREYLGSHALGEFRKCPLLYRQKQLGQIADEDRPAYLLGRAFHTLALEGRAAFEAVYAVGGPVNPQTGAIFGSTTKAFAEWAAAQGRPVLTVAQFDLVERMAESVRQHGIARDLLSAGVAEGVVRSTYRDVLCQIRMDWYDPFRGLVDLKSTDDLTWFEADARRYGYVAQVAFYRAVLAAVIGLSVPVHFIAVEKKPPFRCGVWKVHADVLRAAQQENELALARLKRCRATDTWPTGYEDCRLFDAL